MYWKEKGGEKCGRTAEESTGTGFKSVRKVRREKLADFRKRKRSVSDYKI